MLFLWNSWQFCIKQQYIIEFWLMCCRPTLRSFSFVPYCMGNESPRVDVRAFCNVSAEALRPEEMKDGGWPLEMQPQRHDAHRAIVSSGLVFSSLCSITGAKAQINSIWWLEGGQLRSSGCSPHTNTCNTGQDTWDTVQWEISFFPRCNVIALWCTVI